MTRILLTAAFVAATVSFANAQGSPAAAPGGAPTQEQKEEMGAPQQRQMNSAPVSMPQNTAPQATTKQGPETGSAKDNASAPAR